MLLFEVIIMPATKKVSKDEIIDAAIEAVSYTHLTLPTTLNV